MDEDALRDWLAANARAHDQLRARAETAEATIERVRGLAAEWWASPIPLARGAAVDILLILGGRTR